jgi:hypothetical protein
MTARLSVDPRPLVTVQASEQFCSAETGACVTRNAVHTHDVHCYDDNLNYANNDYHISNSNINKCIKICSVS